MYVQRHDFSLGRRVRGLSVHVLEQLCLLGLQLHLLLPPHLLLVHLHVLHHVVPLDKPAVAVVALVRLLAVVDLAVAVERRGVRQLLAADLALDHRLARRTYLRLPVG